MSWWKAWFYGFVIFGFFAIFTVWLPSRVIRALGGSPDGVSGAVAVVVWALFLAVGIYGLRVAQRRGVI